MHERTVSGRALIAAFTAVALTFTAGIAIAQAFNASVAEAASEIATNSSPSIVYLANMRVVLRELGRRLDARVQACPADDCAPPDLAELRRELAATWGQYRTLPPLEGELGLWPAIEGALAELEAALGPALESAEAAEREPGRGRHLRVLHPLVERLDAALAALSSFDYQRGLFDTARIGALSRRALVAAVASGGVSLALTTLAALLALRAVRRYERSLRDRAEELDAFGGRVAHDIRGPLGNAAMALDVAAAEPSSERTAVMLRRARRSLDSVQQLVDHLLEFARAGAVPARGTSADLGETVENVVAELGPAAEEERVAVEVAGVPAGAVACSPGVLTSVISNLVRNAITHMGVSAVRKVRIRSGRARADGGVRVEIEDTGPGVPASVAPRVFEPFVRGPDVRSSGSGLGLATARRLVTAHGGRIGFESRPGRGSVFWFELPRP